MIVSFIVSLLKKCSPYAIFRAVPDIIIYSFNAMVGRWPWPHIGMEILKRMEPARTYVNSTSSVISKIGIIRISCSSLNFTPYAIFRTFRHMMRYRPLTNKFFPQAATTFGASVFYIADQSFPYVPTPTKASTFAILSKVSTCIFLKCQPPKDIAGIYDRITISHARRSFLAWLDLPHCYQRWGRLFYRKRIPFLQQVVLWEVQP